MNPSDFESAQADLTQMFGHHPLSATRPPAALVASGGGAHGAWQLGFAEVMAELRPTREYDIYCGTSVGGLFAGRAAMFPTFRESVEGLREVWEHRVRRDSDIFRSHWPAFLGPMAHLPALWKGSAFDASPLMELCQEYFNPDEVRAHGKQLRLTTVDLLSGALVTHTQDTIDWRILYATSAFPVAFQPVETSAALYTDGGVREVAPLASAIRAGARQIDILLCQPERSQYTEGEGISVIGRALRTLHLMNLEVLENDIGKCRDINQSVLLGEGEGKRLIDLRVYRPTMELEGSALDFDRDVWERNRELGRSDARLALGI